MPENTRPAETARRVGLVGCVKAKASSARPARDLYVSTLFLGRRAYVERSCDSWWILSAKHGVIDPDEIIEPYQQALKGAGRLYLRSWSADVFDDLRARGAIRPGDVVEFHAGAEYRDFGLADNLVRLGCSIENPTEGMAIGEQLRFYKEVRL